MRRICDTDFAWSTALSQLPDPLEAGSCAPADALGRAREAALVEVDGVATSLHTLRGALADLGNVLGELLARTGEDGGEDPLTATGAALATLVAAMKAVDAELGAPALDLACTEIAGDARDIVRRGLEFQMVAKLTLSTVATLAVPRPELTAYAEAFAGIIERLCATAAKVETSLGSILAARRRTLAEFRRAAADLDAAGARLAAEAAAFRAARDGALGDDIRAAATDLQRTTATELARLVEAIQFADAFAQRSEHIAVALALAAEAPPARAAWLTRVALALSDDLVDSMRASAGGIRSALASLTEAGRAAEAAFARKVDTGDLETALRDRERRLTGAARQVAALAPGIATIERRTGEIGALAASAEERLADLVDINGQIVVSAINAGLIASRMSSSGSPLSVLARAAQDQAAVSTQSIRRCARGIRQLIEAVARLGMPELRGKLDGVAESAGRLGTEASSLSSGGSSLGAAAERIARVLATIDGVGGEASRRLAAIEATLAAFEAATRSLAARKTAAEPVPLDDLRAIYTMQRERDIHDRTLGLVPAPAAEPEVADSLDDILF